MRSPRPRRPAGSNVYTRLDLTGVHLPELVLVGVHRRATMLRSARDVGYPRRTVAPALTRWSRVYVIQFGGDPASATVGRSR